MMLKKSENDLPKRSKLRHWNFSELESLFLISLRHCALMRTYSTDGNAARVAPSEATRLATLSATLVSWWFWPQVSHERSEANERRLTSES